eukprot:10879677-Ditylum_brightwellii.AAC.1
MNKTKGFISFRGPQDIIQAVKSGIKSLAFGFGTGLACLLVPPYALSSKGLPGVLLGVVIGMFGAAGTVISGVVACACFLIAGLIKMPAAKWASWFEGKFGDASKYEWRHYSLDDETESL